MHSEPIEACTRRLTELELCQRLHADNLRDMTGVMELAAAAVIRAALGIAALSATLAWHVYSGSLG